MKRVTKTLAAVLIAAATITACKKDSAPSASPSQNQISQETVAKIQSLGFGANSIQKHEDGYLVEGDIVITEEFLKSVPSPQLLRIANSEQYHTTNLVAAPRAIKVSISTKLPASYVAALDEALARFNAQNLTLSFTRVSSGADINVVAGHGSYLASAGFPTSSGAPYNQVKVNAQFIGGTPNQSYLATILAHELGHCIGFRHTDYMNRAYSCGGSPTNEGASTVGAIHIPGTPTGPDSGSWMLACIGTGQNRPFNNNDKVALDYLY